MADDQDLRIRITTSADTAGVDKLTGSLGQADAHIKEFQDEQQRAAAESIRLSVNSEQAGDAVRKLGESAHGTGRLFYGLREIFGGIEYHRPAEAIRGLINVFGSLGSAIQRVILTATSFGAVVAGPIIVAIQAMKQVSRDNEKEMARVWDTAKARSEAYKAALESIKQASEADTKAMLADIERLSAGWKDLTHSIDMAYSRIKETTASYKALEQARGEAAKAQELLAAGTPEERKAIEAKYAGRAGALGDKYAGIAADTEVLEARVRRKGAEEAAAAAGKEREAAAGKVTGAQDIFETAKEYTKSLREGGAGIALIEQAITAEKEAKAKLEASIQEQEKVNKATEAILRSAQDTIEKAQQTEALAGEKAETRGLETATRKAGVAIEAKDKLAKLAPDIAGLRQQAAAAYERGDYAEQDKAVAALKGLEKEARTLNSAIKENSDSSAAALKQASDKLKQQDRQIKSMRENNVNP